MPCRSDYDYNDSDAWALDFREAKKETDKVTSFLCALLRHLEENYDKEVLKPVFNLNAGLKGWWKNHKSADQERVKKEKKKKMEAEHRLEALAKLTPYEQALLGVK